MNATDYDGRVSTIETILNSIMMMLLLSLSVQSRSWTPQEGQLCTWLPVRDTLPASGGSTMYQQNEPVSRFLLEVCEVEAEPRDRWGHTPLWDAQMFSRCRFTTNNLNVSLVVGQGMIVGVTPDLKMLQNISRRFLLVTSILQEGGSGRSEEASQFDEDGLQRYWRGDINTDDPKLTKVKEMSQN